ncbi:ribonuclease J, partial [Aetokthonos hydrillicola]|uniref:ribonuclease J n=1 Tax=Aetokthonos hydrillicola TaxID=1550245 RepID=UPI001ABAD3A2
MVKTGTDTALKIIPLGGLHEIGKNTCVFEYEDEIVLLDAGLAFPTHGMHGVNIVLPDMTYLRENRHKIKGMIVTHGHEDHIGGIAFHLKQFDIPVIYGPRRAMAMLEGKLEEAGVRDRTELRKVLPRDVVRIGKHFFVEYIRNTHSIADSFTVAIHTPIGLVIHTGDFKFDHTPVDGERFDIQRLAEHGEKGVLCLLSDSTNSEVPGFTPSEGSVYPNLERIFLQTPGRLFVTTFASSVHRINMILQLAQKYDRVVTVVGRSMLNLIAHARNLGYIKCDDNLLQPLHAVRNLPEEKVLILTTGSQGEPMSAMTRIANKEHPHVRIREGDTVVFSANPIPGNTIAVVTIIDKLMLQGANVIYGREKGVHVSGHGCQEDQKLMIALTKPKFFLPVHGEHRMLVKHAQTAQSMGIPASNMIIIQNGDVVELTTESIRAVGKVPAGLELVDTSSSGMVSAKVLQERQRMAEEGIITIAAAIDWNGKLMAKPEIHLRGVVTSIERSLLQKWVQQRIEEILAQRWSEFAPSFDNE